MSLKNFRVVLQFKNARRQQVPYSAPQKRIMKMMMALRALK